MGRVKKDCIVGVFFLLFGLVYFISAFFIGTYKGYGGQSISSSFVPKLLGLALIFLSLILLYQTYGLWKRLKANVTTPLTAKGVRESLFFSPAELRSVLAVFGVLTCYIALLEPVGFVLTSCAFLFASIWIMSPDGKFNWRVTTVISLLVPPLVYVLFVYGLDMLLPEGILG